MRDPCAEAYATLRKSFVALYGEKDPLKGRTLAQEAAEVAAVVSPALTGLSLLHVAEGYAMTGDLKECEAALKRAEVQFDRVDADDVAAPYYTINEFNRLAGSCYLFLDLPDRAAPILRTTVRAFSAKKEEPGHPTGQPHSVADPSAEARRGGGPDAPDDRHRQADAGGGGLNLAFAAGRELRQWRQERWVQDINDRLLALMAAS